MTTVAVTTETTMGRTVQRRRKPTLRLVRQLERELVQAREALMVVTDHLVQKNDELVQARNERDVARDERDSAKNDRNEIVRLALADCDEHRFLEKELRESLRKLDELITDLTELNRGNSEKAYRNGEVAAVLACLVAKSGSPTEVMVKFIEAAELMGVSPEVLGEVQTSLKRGYAAQVEQAINMVTSDQGGLIDELDLNYDLLNAIEQKLSGKLPRR